tara:strand:+ start:1952 stop:2071 length:120 start_codon:yes stop_codon:yes gene_type:complete
MAKKLKAVQEQLTRGFIVKEILLRLRIPQLRLKNVNKSK